MQAIPVRGAARRGQKSEVDSENEDLTNRMHRRVYQPLENEARDSLAHIALPPGLAEGYFDTCEWVISKQLLTKTLCAFVWFKLQQTYLKVSTYLR